LRQTPLQKGETVSDTTSSRGREAATPGQIPASGWKDVGKRVIAEIKADNLPVVAAGVAFYAWIALIPALIALITIYGLVLDPQTISNQITNLTASMSPDISSVISDTVQSATQTGGLSIALAVSVALALWSASGGMDAMIKGINIAYDEPLRSFPKRRALALLLTVGAIIFVILAVAVVAVIPGIVDNLGLPRPLQIAVQIGSYVLLALLMMAALAILYRIAPHRDDPQLKWVSLGAVVATVLWVVGSLGFSFYVNNFGSYNATYGALAGVIVLNLWLFLSSFVVLLGAEINSETEAQTRKDTTKGPPRPMGQRDALKADQVGRVSDGERT
jgi:membrane protein